VRAEVTSRASVASRRSACIVPRKGGGEERKGDGTDETWRWCMAAAAAAAGGPVGVWPCTPYTLASVQGAAKQRGHRGAGAGVGVCWARD